jgi:CubicO group peptidase (beta-lactamase class C family)
MAMAVLEDGKVAWIGGFGVRGVRDSAPVDANTVFEAASLSKPVVAYMALKLVDAGTLDLDRPLREYGIVPDLADARANRITTRMILSHTTGLQNERSVMSRSFWPLSQESDSNTPARVFCCYNGSWSR